MGHQCYQQKHTCNRNKVRVEIPSSLFMIQIWSLFRNFVFYCKLNINTNPRRIFLYILFIVIPDDRWSNDFIVVTFLVSKFTQTVSRVFASIFCKYRCDKISQTQEIGNFLKILRPFTHRSELKLVTRSFESIRKDLIRGRLANRLI